MTQDWAVPAVQPGTSSANAEFRRRVTRVASVGRSLCVAAHLRCEGSSAELSCQARAHLLRQRRRSKVILITESACAGIESVMVVGRLRTVTVKVWRVERVPGSVAVTVTTA